MDGVINVIRSITWKYLPIAGDKEREPADPVGDGVGLITCC